MKIKLPQRQLIVAAPFVLPVIALTSLFIVYPIIMTVWASLNKVDQFGRSHGFVGMANYRNLLSNPDFLAALWRTIVWTIAVVVGTLTLSLLFAVILNMDFRGRGLARTFLLLPWATSLVVVAMLWRWMAHPDFGAIAHLVSVLGISQNRIEWLARPELSFPLMIWIAIWVSIPSTTLMLLAGMQTIEKDLYEAVFLDGAKSFRSFCDITFPMLRPVFAVAVLLNVVFVFNSFPIIWVLTEGGPAGDTDTLVTYLYKVGFRLYDMGTASAISVVIVMILTIFAIIHTKVSWKEVLR